MSTINNFQTTVVSVTPVLDVGAYATGDVLFVPTYVPVGGVVSNPYPTMGTANLTNQKMRMWVRWLTMFDKSVNLGALDVVFAYDAMATIGAVNTAVALTDAGLLTARPRVVPITASYYNTITAGGCAIAQPTFDAFSLEIAAGQPMGFYLAGISRDAKTYGASDITFNIGLELESINA